MEFKSNPRTSVLFYYSLIYILPTHEDEKIAEYRGDAAAKIAGDFGDVGLDILFSLSFSFYYAPLLWPKAQWDRHAWEPSSQRPDSSSSCAAQFSVHD